MDKMDSRAAAAILVAVIDKLESANKQFKDLQNDVSKIIAQAGNTEKDLSKTEQLVANLAVLEIPDMSLVDHIEQFINKVTPKVMETQQAIVKVVTIALHLAKCMMEAETVIHNVTEKEQPGQKCREQQMKEYFALLNKLLDATANSFARLGAIVTGVQNVLHRWLEEQMRLMRLIP